MAVDVRHSQSGEDINVRRQAYLRRFDLEHTFRMIKHTLSTATPRRLPQTPTADRVELAHLAARAPAP